MFIFKGWTPAFIRLAPNTVLMFVFLEVWLLLLLFPSSLEFISLPATEEWLAVLYPNIFIIRKIFLACNHYLIEHLLEAHSCIFTYRRVLDHTVCLPLLIHSDLIQICRIICSWWLILTTRMKRSVTYCFVQQRIKAYFLHSEDSISPSMPEAYLHSQYRVVERWYMVLHLR